MRRYGFDHAAGPKHGDIAMRSIWPIDLAESNGAGPGATT